MYYQEPKSSPDDTASDNGPNNANVWSVLANTERWISDTLDKSNRAANARRDAEEAQRKKEEEEQQVNKPHFMDEKKKEEELPRSDNPYVRKEVSYVCETGGELSVVVGGIFRRVREARELGENHGRGVEARLGEFLLFCDVSTQRIVVHISCEQKQEFLLCYNSCDICFVYWYIGDNTQPTTMRQTNVVVIPNCDEISNFHTFDKLVQTINQARRVSRDFVLKKKKEHDAGEDWV